jgi:hypothetical protein
LAFLTLVRSSQAFNKILYRKYTYRDHLTLG